MILSDTLREHLVAFIGEFSGTFLFLFFAFADVQTANQPTALEATSNGPSSSKLLYMAAIFGVSLAVNVWIFFRVSGGLFNPAVTLALLLVEVISPVRCAPCEGN